MRIKVLPVPLSTRLTMAAGEAAGEQVVCELMSAVQTSLVQSYTDTPEHDGPSVRAGAEPAAAVCCRCDRKDELQPDSLNTQKSRNKSVTHINNMVQHGTTAQDQNMPGFIWIIFGWDM